MKQNNKLPELDFFRSVAIILVFFYHFYVVVGQHQISSGWVWLDKVFLTGSIGVDLFFVLSGFLLPYTIAKAQQKNHFSLPAYFKKRFFRIAPAYYFALLISLIMTPIYLANNTGLWNIGAHLLFIHNLWRDFHGAILGVGWTLGIEMQFYVLVPFLVLLFFKQTKTMLLLLCLAFGMTWGYRYSLFHYYYPEWDFWNKFIFTDQLIGRIDQFILGMFSAFIFLKRPDIIYRSEWASTLIFFLFLAVYGLWIYYYSRISGGFWNHEYSVLFAHSVLGVIFSVLILSSFNLVGFLHQFIVQRLFIFIAQISYGVYLWHLLIMKQIQSLPTSMIYKLSIVLIFTLIMALISYHYIEKPFLKPKKRRDAKTAGL